MQSTVEEVRRETSSWRRNELVALVGAAAAALSLTGLLFSQIAPFSGLLGFVVISYGLFLGLYALLISLDERGPAVRDRVASAMIHSLAFLILLALVFIVVYTLWRGGKALRHLNFFTDDLSEAGSLDPLTVGGILHAIVGTLEQMAIALAITVPLGLACAVFLSELRGTFVRFVRTVVEAMTALPSIVAGLFIYATLILLLGVDKSGFAAGTAISIMMLPIVIRAADVVLRLVPGSLKEASYALGASHWRTVWHVVLPTARSGLTTAIILATARGVGETSPVLVTAGYTAGMKLDPLSGPQVSLPLTTFTLIGFPQPTMVARGFGAAAVLMLLVLLLFALARTVGGHAPGHLSRRQQRRRRRASRRDAERYQRRAVALGLVVAAIAAFQLAAVPAAYADTYVPVSGAGSTWSQNALDQWRKNVNQYGMKINYAGTGSSDGRNQFKSGTVDFGVSEIPYGLADGGVVDYPPTRKFAYMPIVAGGTSFMYNLKIGNQRVTNLRLSGDVIAKIFTGSITNWSDPAIKADNPGLALPARKISPVVRSDGSGTTAQFTTWMSKRYQGTWDAYCAKAGRATPCGVTSNYPVVPGSGFTAQAGSNGVAGYVSQAQNEGTVTYVEYSYALNAGFPVVKVLNESGYYVEPTASNVAVALTQAQINSDLTQNLDGVYANGDKRTYPLSSYSYMIVPTEVAGSFNTDKGRTLGDFGYYFLCEGQQQAEVLGYSPLPINLVQAGLAQVRRIPGVNAQNVDIARCHNPTFSADGTNTLARNAPQPPECDRKGATQCATGTGGAAKTSTPVSGSGGTPAGGSGTAASASAAAAEVDPVTGEPLAGGAAGRGVAAVPMSLATNRGWGLTEALMVLTGLLLVGVTVGPPLVARALSRKGAP